MTKFKNLFLIVVIPIFSLLFLELILLGLSQLIIQDPDAFNSYDNTQEVIRIVTIGESTTDDHAYPPIISWPRQLETLLKEEKYNVQMINLARSASNSSIQAQALIEQVDKINPQLVISMLGINDSIVWLGGYQWYWKFKTVKIFFWIRDYVTSLFHQRNPLSPFMKNKDFFEIKEKIQSLSNSESLLFINRLPSLYPSYFDTSIKAAQFYSALAFEVYPALSSQSSDFEVVFHLYQKSSNEYFYLDEDTFEQFIYTTASVENFDLCVETAKRFLNTSKVLNNLGIISFSFCAEHRPNPIFWNKVFSKNIWRMNSVVTENTLKKSYQLIHHELMQRGIQLAAMQYPTMNLELLKNIFEGKDDTILFISNEENFKQALIEFDFSDLFIDRFASTFGHSTNRGNELIATSAFHVIEKWLNQQKANEEATLINTQLTQ